MGGRRQISDALLITVMNLASPVEAVSTVKWRVFQQLGLSVTGNGGAQQRLEAASVRKEGRTFCPGTEVSVTWRDPQPGAQVSALVDIAGPQYFRSPNQCT